MKVLIDTNILISALLFPNSKPSKVLFEVSKHHEMVLCSQNIYELKEVIERKFPARSNDIDVFLDSIEFEEIPSEMKTSTAIRDASDQPILNAAMRANVDVIVTGDKDFLSLQIDKPRCMDANEFLETAPVHKK